MHTVRTLIVAGLLLAPNSAGAEVWNRSFPAGARPSVRVTTEDAKVTVHAHAAATVDVRVETFGSVTGLRIGKITPKVRIEQRDGRVEVHVETEGISAGITVSTLRFEVEIAVPAGCDLDASIVDGSIMVTGLRGSVDVNSADGNVMLNDLKGDVTLRTVDGSVEAKGLDGRLEGSTHDGTLRVGGRFDDLALETHDGGMDVEVAPGSKLANGWSLTSMDGGIRLRLPEAMKLTLDARVSDGSLDIDLDAAALIEASELRSIRMDLNGGGPVLRIRSSDGSVKIRGGS